MGKQKAPRRVADNEALAVGTTIRGSAQKLNLVAGADPRPQGRRGDEHPRLLEARRWRATPRKVLASAIANAENNHNLDVDALVVAEASVGKSITMKRFAHARPWQVHAHPQAVQPAADRRARAGRRGLSHGSEEQSDRPAPADQPHLGQPLVRRRRATTRSCSRKTSRCASSSSRRCRRRRSRRW